MMLNLSATRTFHYSAIISSSQKFWHTLSGGAKLSRNRQAAAELSGEGNSPFLLGFLSV
jgi:hypothetical protein